LVLTSSIVILYLLQIYTSKEIDIY
jgi:hypothetical protein